MAYFILNPNETNKTNVYKIAADDDAKANETAAQLRSELDGIVAVCNSFLESNSGHAWYSSIETYRNYCRDFDESSITYPLTKSWEKYCEDNSTTYYHPLQIP